MTSPSMTIANTILEQLGGRRFAVMTGAKSFTASGTGLIFKVPNARTADGKRVNYVNVNLNASDLYDVSFSYLTAKGLVGVADAQGIYAEDLQDTFTANTSLLTRL